MEAYIALVDELAGDAGDAVEEAVEVSSGVEGIDISSAGGITTITLNRYQICNECLFVLTTISADLNPARSLTLNLLEDLLKLSRLTVPSSNSSLRPAKKNALTWQMYTAIGDTLKSAAEDDACKVVILTGAGQTLSL